MSFTGIADSTQLNMLTSVLNTYCQGRGIVAASRDREDAARLIMSFFQSGITTEDQLQAALASAPRLG